ncbi:MAG TPA: hypothetical protein PKM25_09710, partial [Candidatus Ozemobacteraceae bacterium]|nr:hypothetical protein [Candidatus Ozemobacteraceae bacterium]
MQTSHRIAISSRISLFPLLCLWFFVFLAPSGLLLGGLHTLIDQDEQLRRALLEQTIVEEMKRYQDDLTPARFIGSHAANAAESFRIACQTSNAGEALRKWRISLPASFGSPLFFLAMGDDLAASVSLKIPHRLPRTWTKPRVNGALRELFYQQRRKTWRFAPEPPRSEYSNAAAFLEEVFGPNGPLMIVEGSVSKAESIFSHACPETVLWYSWFVGYRSDFSEGIPHALVAIREDTVRIGSRLAFAAKQGMKPDLNRTLAIVGGSQSPRFIRKGGMLWYVDVLPPHVTRPMLKSGKYVHHGRLPMAAIGASLAAFAHPLRSMLPLIRSALLLLIICSGLLIVGSAHGKGLIRFSIRGKIMLAIGIGIWIPLIGTILCLASYQRLQRWAYANETLDILERSLETSEIMLGGVDTYIGLDIIDARTRLEGGGKEFGPARINRLIQFNAGLPFRANILSIAADGTEALPDKEAMGTGVVAQEAQDLFLRICRGFAIDLMFSLGSVQAYEPDQKRQLKLRQLADLTQG